MASRELQLCSRSGVLPHDCVSQMQELVASNSSSSMYKKMDLLLLLSVKNGFQMYHIPGGYVPRSDSTARSPLALQSAPRRASTVVATAEGGIGTEVGGRNML